MSSAARRRTVPVANSHGRVVNSSQGFDGSTRQFHYPTAADCFAHRQSLPCKTTAVSIFLLTLGSIMIHLAVQEHKYGDGDMEKLAYLWCVGFITFVPGIWSTYILFGALRKWPGFYYQQVPSFDD